MTDSIAPEPSSRATRSGRSRIGPMEPRVRQMIRVDQAGEFGATVIYAGQRAVFSRLAGGRAMSQRLARQEADEIAHKQAFDALVAQRGVRPTLLAPLWGVAGFGLGVATALMGEKAAHACTVAVEEVIEQHYADQEAELEAAGAEPELRALIAQFRAEEVAHKDEALAEGAREAPAYGLLTGLIKAGCRLAIATSTRV